MNFDYSLYLQSLYHSFIKRKPNLKQSIMLITYYNVYNMLTLLTHTGFLWDNILFRGYRKQEVKNPMFIIGNPKVDYIYNYYLVLLFSTKLDEKKTGYLIGNIKKLGDIIIGVWPFNTQINDITGQKILETYNDIIKNPGNYSSICLISQ